MNLSYFDDIGIFFFLDEHDIGHNYYYYFDEHDIGNNYNNNVTQ